MSWLYVKRYGRGGTGVSVKISCGKEQRKLFEIGAYVAIVEIILISETRRRKVERSVERK